jgi:hypothetical protein
MHTIERNYRKNPHTASFLRTFHDANGANYNRTDTAPADLLDEVPVEAPAFQPTPGQCKLIMDLGNEIAELDATIGQRAATYSRGMTENKAWTPENTKRWIGRLIAKKRELAQAAAKTTAPAATEVADGRYAVEANGVLKFFKVKNGRTPGMVFLDIQASDEWHSIRDRARRTSILAEIAKDPQAAMVRYGRELGICGRCGRTLTDEASRAAGIGPICIDK